MIGMAILAKQFRHVISVSSNKPEGVILFFAKFCLSNKFCPNQKFLGVIDRNWKSLTELLTETLSLTEKLSLTGKLLFRKAVTEKSSLTKML